MAGGVNESDGIWACWGGGQWFWVFGEPKDKIPGVNYTQMAALFDRDVYVCYADGHRLELTGYEIASTPSIMSRMKTYDEGEDKPYMGFDNLPEPEFGTGWDDFDWSK